MQISVTEQKTKYFVGFSVKNQPGFVSEPLIYPKKVQEKQNGNNRNDK